MSTTCPSFLLATNSFPFLTLHTWLICLFTQAQVTNRLKKEDRPFQRWASFVFQLRVFKYVISDVTNIQRLNK